MSKTRFALRILLLLLAVGAAWIGYIQWRKMYPNYYFEKAEAAAEREDFESARLYLAKLIKKHPNNAEAHQRMSQLILEEARANGQPARYRFQPGAVAHLARAAALDPGNEDLQLRLLRAYVQRREITKAAPIAERVYAEDKTNGDAHLVLAWRAVLAKDDTTARRLFDESSGVISRYPFHEFGLKLTHYLDQ